MLSVKQKSARLVTLPVEKIKPSPHQPRRDFDTEALAELADSIARHGLLQPITVREVGRGGYELIAGERRLRAAKLAGLAAIPAILLDRREDEAATLTLIENLHRRDLNCFEEAEGLAALIRERGVTQEQAAAIIGKSQPAVANKLRLLRLPAELRKFLTDASLTERHARALLRLPSSQWEEVACRMADGPMTVARAEQYVERLLAPRAAPRRKAIIKDLRLFFNTLERAVKLLGEADVAARMQVEEDEAGWLCTVTIPRPQR